MLDRLIPDFRFASLTAVSPDWLREHDFAALLVDVDNTLVRRDQEIIPEEHLAWLQKLQSRGIRMALTSNNGGRRMDRIREQLLAAGLDIPLFAWAGKPRKKTFRKACRLFDKDMDTRILVVGDQLFTDVLGAHRCGLSAAWLPPLPGREFAGTRLVRIAEGWVTVRLLQTGCMPEMIR